MGYDKRALVGVGGWLAFFIITLCLNALGSAAQTIILFYSFRPLVQASTTGSWGSYLALTTALGVAKTLGYGVLAWRLNTRHVRSTPRFVVSGLWLLALVPPLIDSVAGAALLDVGAREAGQAFGIGLLRPLIYVGIWTAYLHRSERVSNTYTDDGDAALAETFA